MARITEKMKKASHCLVGGGSIKDVPAPHLRLFDKNERNRTNGRKRRVIIRINTYVGAVADAVHYNPTIELEHNPIWNAAKGMWCEYFDDREGRPERIRPEWSDIDLNGQKADPGQYFNPVRGHGFFTSEEAEAWVRKTLRKYFPLSKYQRSFDFSPETPAYMKMKQKMKKGD